MYTNATGALEVLWHFERVTKAKWLDQRTKNLMVKDLIAALPTPRHALSSRDTHFTVIELMKAYLNGNPVEEEAGDSP